MTECERVIVRDEHAKNTPTWGKNAIIIRAKPTVASHINYLSNVKVTEKFFGEKLPDGWIDSATIKGATFSLHELCLLTSSITFDELAALCDSSEQLEKLCIMKCTALNGIRISDIALWSRSARTIVIDMKGLVFDTNWIRLFMDRNIGAGEIESFIVRNIPIIKNDPLDLREFLLHHVLSIQKSVVTISFAGKIKPSKLAKCFGNYFQKVTKYRFNQYKSTEKFILKWYSKADNDDNSFYFVSTDAINANQLVPALERLQT